MIRAPYFLTLAFGVLVVAVLGIAILGVLPGGQARAESLVLLKQEAVIRGDVVRLGDLFEGLGEEAETAVARAPAAGTEVELDARWLAALARTYSLTWRPASRFVHIVVSRPAQIVGLERIQEEILVEILAQHPDLDLSVDLDDPSTRLVLPEESDASLAIQGLAIDLDKGRFRAQIVSPASGRPLVQIAVTGRIDEMVEIPVLERAVSPGDVVRANDLGWQRVRAERVSRGIVREAERLIGFSPRRPISLSQPVRVSDLRTPVAVAKNSLVVISLATDRMTLTVQGRALENGAVGDVIRVSNTKSNNVINAVVVREGLVEVPFIADLASN